MRLGCLESKSELRKCSNEESMEIYVLHRDDGRHESDGPTVIAPGEDVHLDEADGHQLEDGLTVSGRRRAPFLIISEMTDE